MLAAVEYSGFLFLSRVSESLENNRGKNRIYKYTKLVFLGLIFFLFYRVLDISFLFLFIPSFSFEGFYFFFSFSFERGAYFFPKSAFFCQILHTLILARFRVPWMSYLN